MEKIEASTKERVLAGAGVFAMITGAFVVGYFNPTTAGFFPTCLFHSLTGLNCPGCGLTRGVHALLHGDVSGALHFNLLLPFFVFFFGYLALSLLLTSARGNGLSWKIFTPKTVAVFMTVTVVFGVVRNLPFYPFDLLAI